MFVEKSSIIDLLKKITEKNERTTAVVAEACQNFLELDIPEDVLVDARIRKLVAGVRKAQTELAKVQFELNLKIIELELRPQPSTPPEFREQRETTVKDVTAERN